MDERIKKLKTSAECDRFERNALRSERPDLVADARRRAFELRAEEFGAKTQLEKECLEAVFAYEKVLSEQRRRKTRATRTWQMIKRHGILATVERVVCRPEESAGYGALVDMGLEQCAFEAVVLLYQDLFSVQAVNLSQKRIAGN